MEGKFIIRDEICAIKTGNDNPLYLYDRLILCKNVMDARDQRDDSLHTFISTNKCLL